MRRQLLLAIGTTLWLLLIGVGMGVLWRHTLTPGEAADVSRIARPGQSPVSAGNRFTVVMWCHPRCPCTGASLSALTSLVRRAGAQLDVRVYFCRPSEVTEDWTKSENWRLASAIPGARVLEGDVQEARRYGARTSGQALLFGKNADLRFSGGLTPGRGQLGQSEGLEIATRMVRGGGVPRWEGPVYGCSLFGSQEGLRSVRALPDNGGTPGIKDGQR